MPKTSSVRQLTRDVRSDDFAESADLSQRDVDQNYGGDRVKAVLLQHFEQKRPMTRICLKLAEEPQKAYNERRFGKFQFNALLIAGAATYEAVRNEEITVPDGVEITGEKDDQDRPIVHVVSEDGLKHLLDRIKRYREEKQGQRTRQDAMDALNYVRREIADLKAKNPVRIQDFKPADKLFAEAQAIYGQNTFRDDVDRLDWGPVVQKAYEALDNAGSSVQAWMHKRATTMLAQLKGRVDTDRVSGLIEAAASIEDKKTSIGNLWGIVKNLRESGADDPANTRQGVGNRPESTGGSHDPKQFNGPRRGDRSNRFERRGPSRPFTGRERR